MAKSILVIDDSSSFRTVVSMALRQGGYDVVEAADGQEGLEKVDAGQFSMVICDLNMPRLDGFNFTRKLKASSRNRFVPVLMLTTEIQDSKKAEGKAAGVSGWLGKPFQPSRLLLAVKTLCPA
jgi:two-component system, chemotaxis family, chemotaxis protein CheY